MSCGKSLINEGDDGIVTMPYARFMQTSNSISMSTAVEYTVKPISGSGNLLIWSDIVTEGGISIDNSGEILFVQEGVYIAVLKVVLNTATEYGRVRFQIKKVGATTEDRWINADEDLNISSGFKRTHNVGIYDIKSGDKVIFTVFIGNAWQTVSQTMITNTSLVIYRVA